MMWWLGAYDLLFGAVWGAWYALYYRRPPVVTLKVIPAPVELPELPPEKSYVAAYAPIIHKFEVGSTFGDGTRFNAEGSKAMAHILKDLASKLDHAVKMSWAERAKRDGRTKQTTDNSYIVKQARVTKPTK